MKKRILVIIISIFALTTLIVVGCIVYYNLTKISYKAVITGSIVAPVTINRDKYGFASIKASSPGDLYYAIGFLHAQDRLQLIEYYRAIADGQLSSLVGKKAQALDKLAAVIGFAWKAQEIEKELKGPYIAHIKSYIAGVNAASKSSRFKSIVKSEWKVADVIAILLMLEWTNSYNYNKEVLFQLPEKYDTVEMRNLFPSTKTKFYKKDIEKYIKYTAELKKLINSYVGQFQNGHAFYVHKRYTQDNTSYTGYSYRDDLVAYPGWFPVTIDYKDTKIRTLTFAGMPFIFSGKNNNFSFFSFNLAVDTQDFSLEQVNKIKDILYYKNGPVWEQFIVNRNPVIRSSSNVHVVTWSTKNGPVLNDIFSNDEYKDFVLTISSIFPKKDYIEALFDIPFAKDMNEGMLIARNCSSLPKAYLFSDSEHSITLLSGMMPYRKNKVGFWDQDTPAWSGVGKITKTMYYIRDNASVGTGLAVDLPPEFRQYFMFSDNTSNRIADIIGNIKKAGNKDVWNILYDSHSLYAENFLSIFLPLLKENPMTSSRLTRIYFRNWKYTMHKKNVAPAIYYALVQNFIRDTIQDELGEYTDSVMQNYAHLIPKFYKIVKENKSLLFNIKDTDRTESRDMVFDRAFLKSMRFLNRELGPIMNVWKWGHIHTGEFKVPFLERSVLDSFAGNKKINSYNGGNESLLHGSVDLQLKAGAITSVIGFHSGDISKIQLNFNHSIDSRSHFSYDKNTTVGPADFYDKDVYVTKIAPVK